MLTAPIPPTVATTPSTQIVLPCTFGGLEAGIQQGDITPSQILQHAFSRLTADERLALVGITRDPTSGELLIHTNTGPERLIPLPLAS